ncbi:MAG TPA: hypothetical protein VLA71_04950 [Algoriphagus sp.]|nr:hypothetical protein [Algoriphagus sp.]
MSPNKNSNIHWERLLAANPDQIKKVKLAREIVLNLSSKEHSIADSELLDLWNSIDSDLGKVDYGKVECEVIPINSGSILKKHEFQKRGYLWYSQWLRVAGILIIAFSLSLVFSLIYKTESPKETLPVLVFEEHKTPPGVKSTMTL